MKLVPGLMPDNLRNPALLVGVEELFGPETSPVARWIARQYELGVDPTLPKLRNTRALHWVMGLGTGHPCASMATWAFMFGRDPSLRALCEKDVAFHARRTPWPFSHPVLDRLSPEVWAASYHPVQHPDSPLLRMHGLDQLSAWTYQLTDTVDEALVRQQLDECLLVPGFRVWVSRLNILPLPVPPSSDPVKVMESRYEILDSPLSYPLMRRRYAGRSFVEDQNLLEAPTFAAPGIPYSNGKFWELLDGRPDSRWSLMTWATNADGLKVYRKCMPYLKPRNSAYEVHVAGVYFKSLKAAALYFRVPYETVRSRQKSGKPLEMCLGLNPMFFKDAGYTRATSHEDHWNRIYLTVEER